jgi:hypothetical protein
MALLASLDLFPKLEDAPPIPYSLLYPMVYFIPLYLVSVKR